MSEQAAQLQNLIIGVFGFLMVLLITIIGFFLKGAFASMQTDRDENKKDKEGIRKALVDEKISFEAKLEKTADVFSSRIQVAVTGFMNRFGKMENTIEKLAENMGKLANAVIQNENDSKVRFEAMTRRIDEQHEEIIILRAARHEIGNLATKAVAAVGLNNRRIDLIESMLIENPNRLKKKIPGKDPSYIHPQIKEEEKEEDGE